MSSTPTWQIAASADLTLIAWEDGCVIHHAASNDTHRVSCDAGRLLAFLLDGTQRDEIELSEAFPDIDIDGMLVALRKLFLVISNHS